jgi:hypothetical protein
VCGIVPVPLVMDSRSFQLTMCEYVEYDSTPYQQNMLRLELLFGFLKHSFALPPKFAMQSHQLTHYWYWTRSLSFSGWLEKWASKTESYSPFSQLKLKTENLPKPYYSLDRFLSYRNFSKTFRSHNLIQA